MDRRLARGVYVEAPLYAEVRKRILGTLQSGEWVHGTRLPTEPQLAARYGVSVGTIRKAVDALVAERILLRQAGRGTYVSSHTEESDFGRYLQFFTTDGERVIPRAELIAFSDRKASQLVAARLGIAPGAAVIQIRNLRLWRGKPCMLDQIYLPRTVMPKLTREMFVARGGSIYGLYQERGGLTVLRVEESLGAVQSPPDIAARLGLPDAAPVLLVERTAFSFEDKPIEFRFRYVNSRLISYRNVIGLRMSGR